MPARIPVMSLPIVLVCGLFPTARAQTTSSDTTAATDTSVAQVSEVVVTAQRRAENLQNTPVAVSAISGATLQEFQVQKVEDLNKLVPELTVQQTTASQSSLEISLRGASEQSGGLATSESPVGIYLDDVYQSRLSGGNLNLGDIERIEVLRGPQGTLYGRNSMTGAINIITQQPDGVSKGHAEATVGTYDEWRFDGGVGGKIDDHVGGTVAALFDHSGGWQYDTTLQRKVGETSLASVRGALGLLDTGPLTAVVRAGYYDQYGQGQYFTPVNANPPYNNLVSGFGESRTPLLTQGDERQASFSLNVAYVADAVTFRSISAYQRLYDQWTLEFSGGFEPAPDAPIEAGFLRDNHTNENQITQEFQVSGTALDSTLRYIGGFFFYDESANETLLDYFGAGVTGPFAATLLPSILYTTSKSWAEYGQAEWTVVDRLTLVGGVRYTRDVKTFVGQIQNGFAFPFTLAHTAGNLTDDVWTPKGTLQFQATDDVLAYLTIARGYRAGGFNALAIGTPSVFGQPYKPEFVTSYEAGAKTEFWDKKAKINVAVFDEKITDLQETVVVPDGTTLTENAAAAAVKGVEFEGEIAPIAGLRLFANLALTYDHFENLAPSSTIAQAGATLLPIISKVSSDVGASWRVTPALLAGRSFTIAADDAYKSPLYTTATDTLEGYVNASNRVNASATLQSEDRHWEVRLAGTNIFDEHHYIGGYGLIPGLISTRLAAPPAMGTLSFSYHY
jgi:iron complex outermembrane receptor protein